MSAPRRRGWIKWVIIAVSTVVVLGGGVGYVVLTGLFVPKTPPASPWAVPPVGLVTPEPTFAPPPPPKDPWPLTGVRGDVVQRPALVVKVENAPESRPHIGLEAADLVFEEMVEGGVTRFAAVFHSTLPEQIVPVRSLRPMDGPIASWTGGLMVFSGGQAPFVDRAERDGLQIISMDYGDDGFSRVKDRDSPHDVSGDPQVFLAQADAHHQASPPRFAEFSLHGTGGTAMVKGTPATTLSVAFSGIARPTWTWDPGTKRWLRTELEGPAVNADGVQLGATNIIVVSVNVVSLTGTDAAGTHIPESIVVGGGAGLVATGGMTAPITWAKDSETSAWRFYDEAGIPINLLPGNTWIELVPKNSGGWSVS